MPNEERIPDKQDIDDEVTHLERLWGPTHLHWQNVIDPWYWQTVDIWTPSNAVGRPSTRPQYRPSTARALVDRASDTWLSFEPHLHREPVGTGNQHEKDADEVETSTFHVIMDAQIQSANLGFKQAGKYGADYGYWVLKAPFLDDMSLRPEKPDRADYKGDTEGFELAEIDYKNSRKFWNPIRIEAPHPSTVLMDPGKRNPDAALPVMKMFAKDVYAAVESRHIRIAAGEKDITAFPLENLETQNPWEQWGIKERWSIWWHVMMRANGEIMFTEKNTWGYQPFQQAFAGFGQERTGEAFEGDPIWAAQGIIDSIIPALYAQAQSMSAKHNAIVERGFPRMGSEHPEETAQQLAQEGAILEGKKDDIWWMNAAELERGLVQYGEDINNDIELGTFARDVAGLRQQGVSTVGQQAILSQASARKFVQVSKQLDYMATVVARNILKLVDRLGDEITVASHTLKPSIIHHDYAITAEFQQVDPILQLQRQEHGLQEVTKGIKSKETYRETDLRVANESLEKDRLIKEKVREMPEYFFAMAEIVAMEDGMDALSRKFKEMKDAAAGLAPEEESPPSATGVSPAAGGAAIDSVRNALTGDVGNQPRTPLPTRNGADDA